MSGGTGGATLAAGGAGGTIDPTTGAANAGADAARSQTNAAGGGGGSAGSGGGGAGAHNLIGFNMSSTGGTGGTGGSNAIGPLAVSTGTNAVSGTAGNGTQGTTGNDAVGGGGGEGGYGLILTGSSGAFSNTGALTGGTGGNAIDNAVGGDGGIAIDVLASGVTLTNSAALTGGNAGTGRQTTYTNGNPNPAVYGKGGAAIAGANLTINDSGNLTGGLNGDGSQGAAIDFTGGANTLNITGGTVAGGIIDTGSLALQGRGPMYADGVYSGISGTGSVDVASRQIVSLSGTNTYSGGTTVEGNLTLGNSASGSIIGDVAIARNGNMSINLASPSATVNLGAVSGGGILAINEGTVTLASDTLTGYNGAAGTANFSSTLTLTGNATGSILNEGTLNLAPTGTTSATVINGLVNAGTLNLAPTGAASLTISGVISDYNTGDLIQAGTVVAKSGTTILSGTNTYSGATYLQGGVIDAENASAFGTGTVYAVDPEIDYGPASGAVGRDVLSATQANAIELDVGGTAANDPTILKVASGFTETISGNITTGSGTNSAGQTIDANQPLVVNGGGTLVLSGANSFSGGTTLGGSGTLELGSASAAGASGGTGTDGAVAFATGSSATLRIDQAATTQTTDPSGLSVTSYANPISNFAYGETIDFGGFLYSDGTFSATAALSGGTLTVTRYGSGEAETLTNFADAPGQSGQFVTADDHNGGTLVTLLPPPPAAPTNLAEVGTATLGNGVEITGTGDAAGDTISLYADGGATIVGTGTVGSDKTFSISTNTAYADGSHTFTATETSATTGETSANSGGSTLYSFSGSADGSSPRGVLFADAAGNLLGTTYNGGTLTANGYADGTVFEIANTSGSASAPVYAGAPTTLYTFDGVNTDGAEPTAGLIADANGNLFGTTAASGYNNNQNNGPGVVFEVLNTGTTSEPAYANGAATVDVIGNQNTGLNAGLVIDAKGDLFGTTAHGGANGNGSVFEIANTGSVSAPAYGNPSTFYSFTGQGTDGASPQAGLIADVAGDLFGTTARGGANGNGTVFEIANTGTPTAPVYATTPTTLYSFTGGTDGASPQAGLIVDTAGDLFGTTASGGANGNGAVFEIAKNANGSYATAPTTLASFGNAAPIGSLTIDAAGNLYGTTGGAGGTVFEIAKTNGTYASTPITLHSFTGQGTDGAVPFAGLLAIAGALYGTTLQAGAVGYGTVFETIPTGIAPVLIAALPPTLTRVVGTPSNGGTLTVQGTTPDAAGDTITLYNGATVLGTSTVQFGPIMGGANTFTVTTGTLADGSYNFTATDTSADGTTTSPVSNTLTATVSAPAPTGLHQVGTTANGGTVTIAGTGDAQGDTIKLYKGTTASVANQIGTGTVGANGAFTATAALPDGSYTITATDTSADGTVSAVSSPSTSVSLNMLYSFTGQGTDGATPQAGLIADAAGDLFGTTAHGGANGSGTVFELTDTNGVYATTPTTLYSFTGGSDGATPQASLIVDGAGDLFGTTVNGGANGSGTVFEIANTSGSASAPDYANPPTTLYSFTGGDNNDGASPDAGLFADAAGNLLGTTLSGGTNGDGTVFEIANTSGSASAPTYANPPTTLYRFTGRGNNGASPYAGLIADAAGDLFGTTANGGANGYGTVFEITYNNGTYAATAATLYSFTGGTDGANPEASLIIDRVGDLFGTTAGGGANGHGTVFEIADNNGTYATTPTTLVSFNGTDGSSPKAGLIADAAGNLYGTTTGGGAYGNSNGEIFEVVKNADGSFAATPTVLHSFDGTDGRSPQASLLLAASGTLLGTTQNGGAGNAGTVFALTSQVNQPTAIVTATAPTGLAQKGTATSGGPIEITGTGDASGDTITLYNGTTLVGSGTAGAGGAFDVTTTTNFSTGSYTLTATDTSVDGTQVSAMSAGVTATVAAPAVAPTIAGVQTATQATTSEMTVTPFSTVTVSDSNNSGTNSDTLTITQTGTGTLSGTGLVAGASAGTYTLTGTAAAITTQLDALVFTPVDGVPNTSVTTSFTLQDADATAGMSSTTSGAVRVTDSDPAVAPTIAGVQTATQATTSEATVTPFSTVTVSDPNKGGANSDTLTITQTGTGTLSGTGLTAGATAGTYTLTGTAASITTQLDALVFTPVDGVANTSVTTSFTLQDADTTAGTRSTTSGAVRVTDTDPAIAPTITGVQTATQATTSEATVTPFSTVTVSDPNKGGANTDTLTITQSGTGTLSGAGLAPGAGGTYTLTGTAAAITSQLDALVFTPVDGVPNTAVTTSFTLRDADATAGTRSTTSAAVTVTDSDPAVAPTIGGVQTATQATTSEAPVTPFSTVTVSDSNKSGTNSDTLTITQSGTGTLSGAGLAPGAGGTYTLTGTAAAITTQLEALVFTPVDGVANTTVTTSFTLQDADATAGTRSTRSAAVTVTDSDPAVAPTIGGVQTATQATTSEATVTPFSTVTVSDPNKGGANTDTLTITQSGTGTLSGAGLAPGAGGTYTLSGTAASITTQLDALVFTPVDGVPNTAVTTSFILRDADATAGTSSATSTTVTVTDSDPAVVPTISGTVAGQQSTSEAPVQAFSMVTIGDTNANASDTLTISLSGGGGTLAGAGTASNRVYTLTGTAAQVTSQLDAVTFTPTVGAPNTSATTTFTLSDTSSAYPTATTSTGTTVTNNDPYVGPTIAITAPSSGSSVAIIDPTISGLVDTADAGSTVTVTNGQTVLGTTTVASDGTWAIHPTFATDGTYTVTASDTNSGGTGQASVTFMIDSTPNQSLFGMLTHDVTSLGGSVYALYETILGRAPDATGFESAVAALQAGASLSDIAQGMLASPEYASDYGASVQSDSGFVTQLYMDGLHRQPDADGLQTWTDALGNGQLSRAQVALDIATSAESQGDLASTFQVGVSVPSATDASIARLYYGLLDRAPDAGGLQNWEAAVAGGTSLTQVAQDFLSSPEYQGTAVGQGNLSYVEGLYQAALGRVGEAGAVQNYETALNTGAVTRVGVANAFLESTEFQNDEAGQSDATYVNAVYQAALGRQADPNGLQTWDDALASGMSRATVAQDIVGSAEFQTNVAAPGHAAFVNALYEGALGRPADAGGLATWQSQLANGASAASVALGIAESPEATAHLAPSIEAGFHAA